MKLADPSLLKTQCLINGRWLGLGVDPVHNPATAEELARVPNFGTQETIQAIEAAGEAFTSWSKKTGKQRAATLRQWFDLIIANQEDFKIQTRIQQNRRIEHVVKEL